MGLWGQNPTSCRLVIDGAASATAFAAITGGRWSLQGGVIGWSQAASCTISLYEIDSTNSAPFFTFQTSATNGAFSFYLGDVGVPASSSYSSRMVFNTGAAGTFTAMFTGHSTGQ